MINNKMNPNIKTPVVPKTKPNDSVGFCFSSFIKIYDPNSKEVLVQKRGD